MHIVGEREGFEGESKSEQACRLFLPPLPDAWPTQARSLRRQRNGGYAVALSGTFSVRSFVRLFVRLFVCSFVCSFVCLFVRLFHCRLCRSGRIGLKLGKQQPLDPG